MVEVRNLKSSTGDVETLEKSMKANPYNSLNSNSSVNSYYDEVYRPQFHFSPETMWLNDPNGLVYYEGEYHLFYQHHPDGMTHGPMYWGHAVSRDLVYWEHLPIALYPDLEGFIFSGSAVVDQNNISGLQTGDEKVIVAFFTHASETGQSQSIAYSNDKGRTWTKYEGNPIIAIPGIKDFRDPFVFWNETYGKYNMIVTMGDRLRIYSSDNLTSWNYESEFGKEEGSHGGVWECPALIELGVEEKENEKRWLLIVSVFEGAPAGGCGTQYFIGQFDGKTFINENSKETILWADYGKDNYAGVPWNGIPEEDGRAIFIGWMNNWIYANKIPTSTWRGAMTVPREFKLSYDKESGVTLVQNPIQELTKLRNKKVAFQNKTINQHTNLLSGIQGDIFEIIAEITLNPDSQDVFSLTLRKGALDIVEMGYSYRDSHVYIDRTSCGEAFDENYPGIHKAPLKSKNGKLKLHIFLDRSSVELFANDGETVITDQIFPIEGSSGMELFAVGKSNITRLEIYELKSIWRETKPNTRDKLIAYWPFNEGEGNATEEKLTGIRDKINYVFNDAMYKPQSYPEWKPGILGNALWFDGYSTWISRKSEKIQNPQEALTIDAWVAPCSFGQGDENILSPIVSQCSQKRKEGYILGVTRYGKWSFQIGTGEDWIELWSDNYLETNRWSHITGVFDGGKGTLILYLNGQRVAALETKKGIKIVPADIDFLIGRNNEDEDLNEAFVINMFHGLMDEIKIYKNALSPDEMEKNSGQWFPELVLKQQRNKYKGDRYRPEYHFAAPEHWMNEPHGPLYFNGQYHLFYQHNPKGPYFGNIHWGHTVSRDMVHWRDLPFALVPKQGEMGPDGCWSGSSVIDDSGIPTLLYTAGDFSKNPNQMVAIAKSTFDQDKDNDLIHWIKNESPAVIQKKGQGYFGEFRDPFVWKEDNRWYMLVGSGIPGQGGTALVYTSEDLLNWEYGRPLFAGNVDKYPKTGRVWELPVLFNLGTNNAGLEKHVLLINPCYLEPSPFSSRFVFYWTGTWDKERLEFFPDFEEPQMFDYGEHFTGPSGMVDSRGKNILFSIAQDRRSEKQHHDSGWAHNAGLPVVLSLGRDGGLRVEPISQLQSLRREMLVSCENMPFGEVNQLLQNIKGNMLEIRLEVQAGRSEEYGISVLSTTDGEETTLIQFNENTSFYCVDRRNSSLGEGVEKDVKGGILDLNEENLNLHIYIDHSMIEAYANGKKSITTRAYPTRKDAEGVKLWGTEDTVVRKLQIWQLASAYEE